MRVRGSLSKFSANFLPEFNGILGAEKILCPPEIDVILDMFSITSL